MNIASKHIIFLTSVLTLNTILGQEAGVLECSDTSCQTYCLAVDPQTISATCSPSQASCICTTEKGSIKVRFVESRDPVASTTPKPLAETKVPADETAEIGYHISNTAPQNIQQSDPFGYNPHLGDQPQLLNCDASKEATMICDLFCKSQIRAIYGLCNVTNKACVCVGEDAHLFDNFGNSEVPVPAILPPLELLSIEKPNIDGYFMKHLYPSLYQAQYGSSLHPSQSYQGTTHAQNGVYHEPYQYTQEESGSPQSWSYQTISQPSRPFVAPTQQPLTYSTALDPTNLPSGIVQGPATPDPFSFKYNGPESFVYPTQFDSSHLGLNNVNMQKFSVSDAIRTRGTLKKPPSPTFQSPSSSTTIPPQSSSPSQDLRIIEIEEQSTPGIIKSDDSHKPKGSRKRRDVQHLFGYDREPFDHQSQCTEVACSNICSSFGPSSTSTCRRNRCHCSFGLPLSTDMRTEPYAENVGYSTLSSLNRLYATGRPTEANYITGQRPYVSSGSSVPFGRPESLF